MGQLQSEWQDCEHVLSHFGKRVSSARKKYAEFFSDGTAQGRREELTGGGLIRSVGGWKELSALRKFNVHQHNDERILGDSDFVESVLKGAQEALLRTDQYRQEGYGLDEILQLVACMYSMEANEITGKSKQPMRVQARSLICFWAVRKLGLTVTSVAHSLGISQPVASRAVQRGEQIAKEQNYSFDKMRKSIMTLPSP